jgi:hypothetical protein
MLCCETSSYAISRCDSPCKAPAGGERAVRSSPDVGEQFPLCRRIP